jgi:hypothetical protein
LISIGELSQFAMLLFNLTRPELLMDVLE